jgi:hypothetical protein
MKRTSGQKTKNSSIHKMCVDIGRNGKRFCVRQLQSKRLHGAFPSWVYERHTTILRPCSFRAVSSAASKLAIYGPVPTGCSPWDEALAQALAHADSRDPRVYQLLNMPCTGNIHVRHCEHQYSKTTPTLHRDATVTQGRITIAHWPHNGGHIWPNTRDY